MAQVTLLWSDRAITDLEQIADFIALDSPAGATSFVTKVLEAVSTLQAFRRPAGLYRNTENRHFES
jgi:plasmid stabilization system protein ParE